MPRCPDLQRRGLLGEARAGSGSVGAVPKACCSQGAGQGGGLQSLQEAKVPNNQGTGGVWLLCGCW